MTLTLCKLSNGIYQDSFVDRNSFLPRQEQLLANEQLSVAAVSCTEPEFGPSEISSRGG